MTVRHGREFLSIPGPTTVPDEVLAAMHRPAVDIYSGPLLDTTASCLADLQKLFRTRGQTYIYIANGHGGWEAVLCNLFSRGDKVLVLESGLFAAGWGRMAESVGVAVEILPGNWRCARTRPVRSRPCSSCRSIPPPASSTTSRASARP